MTQTNNISHLIRVGLVHGLWDSAEFCRLSGIIFHWASDLSSSSAHSLIIFFFTFPLASDILSADALGCLANTKAWRNILFLGKKKKKEKNGFPRGG